MVILVLPRLNAILYNICELMDSFFFIWLTSFVIDSDFMQ